MSLQHLSRSGYWDVNIGQHSSFCTAKTQEKGSCERIFEVTDVFALKVTFQHTILTFNQLTFIHTESSENHRLSENSREIEDI